MFKSKLNQLLDQDQPSLEDENDSQIIRPKLTNIISIAVEMAKKEKEENKWISKVVPYEDEMNEEEIHKYTNNNLDKSSNNLNNSLEESNDSMLPTSKIKIKEGLNVPTSVQLL